MDLDAGTDAIPPHIIANLVDTGAMASAEEQAELYQGLLRFVAVMFAQIMSALQEGAEVARRQRETDNNAMMQTYLFSKQGQRVQEEDVQSLMQEAVAPVDPFGEVLRNVLRQLDRMPGATLQARLRWIRDQVDGLGENVAPGQVLWQERLWRLRAMLVGYLADAGSRASSSGEVCTVAAEDEWAEHTWHMMRPFLFSPGIGGEEDRNVIEVG